MRHPCLPKGRACGLNGTYEYIEGKNSKIGDENPYDFWDEYEKNYAWCIGSQKRGH